ncbi:mitochondrial ribosomal protein S31 [Calliopsis andreniformis]|uniref:mitochondrial ribosomal protein S31 n=1 Tax=Calliopsis andreniformis TaxID=337506 RepID=UPI003FCD855A
MLSTRVFSKNIKTQVILPCQWLSITINTIRLKSNLSSSDSDSDSNTEKQDKIQTKSFNSRKSNEKNDNDLSDMINNLLNTNFSKRTDIGIAVRNREGKIKAQLSKVAETLTTAVGGDKKKILSMMLNNLSEMEKGENTKKRPKIYDSIEKYTKRIGKKDYLNNKILNKEAKFIHGIKQSIKSKYRLNETPESEDKYNTKYSMNEKPSINTRKEITREHDSVIQKLLKEQKQEKQKRVEKEKFFPTFTEGNVPSPNVPELKIWDACEEFSLKLWTTYYPESAFQEMIQWTEEGMLWKFPINNEQGMEEEQNVHFSEHIFLERHLTGWCPTKGPIRHFMELVCIGLSKNPYMTIQEKYDHIMWYKNYFDDQKDLLKELGLAGTISSDSEKQIEPQ